jgi:hypothetical protein
LLLPANGRTFKQSLEHEMPFIVFAAIGLWFLFGQPAQTVANWFWASDAAPWETVDAFYYPNRDNLIVFKRAAGFDSVQACRDWVYSAASANSDAGLKRGDYECGIQKLHTYSTGISVYRATVR